MAISRMQEPRQLYGLGSLVRKITRPIKKAVKGLGKVAKSPIGKLLYSTLVVCVRDVWIRSFSFFSRFNPGNLQIFFLELISRD